MLFDCVLDEENLMVFNGSPEDTKEWVSVNLEETDLDHRICIGRSESLVTVREYLRR